MKSSGSLAINRFFFQYINGSSLDTHIQDKNLELSWSMRVKLASDISQGMKYLHNIGMFHRDLTSKVRSHIGQKHDSQTERAIISLPSDLTGHK